MKEILSLSVNGETHELAVDPRRTLSEVLRESLGLTGTKESCAMGECGACTVLIDGEPWLACITLAFAVQGKEVTTVEGLMTDGRPHPLQVAFAGHGGAQCGFCTPGIIMSAKALLDKNPTPSAGDVRKALSGNLCRCTGYAKIIDSVLEASQQMLPDGM